MRFVLVTALVALVVAGCGSARERPASARTFSTPGTGTLPQAPEPPARHVPATVQARLDAGHVAVVDVTGHAGYKPTALEIAQDAELTGMTWSRWGADGATGTGTLAYNACNPTCAAGADKRLRVTVELSAPRSCPAGAFFDRSKVTPSSGAAPASFLRAPC